MSDIVLEITSDTAFVLLATIFALIVVYAIAWTAGSGWVRGTATTAQRVAEAPRPAGPSWHRPATRSAALGGLCMYRHYVEPHSTGCRLGHRFSLPVTLNEGGAGVERARREHEAATR